MIPHLGLKGGLERHQDEYRWDFYFKCAAGAASHYSGKLKTH
jgi:hypothetical protein